MKLFLLITGLLALGVFGMAVKSSLRKVVSSIKHAQVQVEFLVKIKKESLVVFVVLSQLKNVRMMK